MKSVLVIGLGRFGRHIALKMAEQGHQLMVIDKKEDRVDSVARFVTNAQIGDSTNEDFLRSLGIRNFDVCIVAIGDDFQSSLETTSLLKELGAPYVVARAARSVHEKFLLRNGADEVVYPEKQLADWVAIRSGSEHVFDYIDLGNDFAIFELDIPKSWVGKSIAQYGVNILAIKREGVLSITITPDTVFSGSETMLVLGKDNEILKKFHI